ncbi:MAG: ThuA domain-containing protein, partial [Acidobacteria bacterium]|nr:ThuA domain-containing protein [Acidobacteriota bacterium]
SVELSEGGSPVFVYNHGMMLKEGVPADRTRCCYLHPVYAPNGVVITDDFPRDHYHHRGISWMWPVVIVDGRTYDLWTIKGIHARFEKWDRKEAGKNRAVLAVQDGWYIGDRKVVEENVEIVVHPAADGRRDMDFTVRFVPVGANVSIAGSPESHKGYGGFNIRFARRTGTVVRTPERADAPDSDLRPQPWAELTGDFGGQRAGARITIDPSNPGSPNGWCLRHYGFLGVEFPGLEPYRLDSRQPLVMKFRVSLLGGTAAGTAVARKILVYTRNGKGYVHDNIASSVEAIRKMGAENGFAVDVSDDPAVFTDANLKQYRALVFSNSNNEAFTTDAQREAFKRYIESGGGFVGIHSACGSERQWPYFWSVLGGKFLRHPKMQSFLVRVKNAKHPATRGLPATFDWTDECYYLDHLSSDLHVLLVTDPAKIQDPQKSTYPGDRFGDSLPLAWYHTFDGGREFYTALGHKKEDYANPLLTRQILGGILWAMGEGQL